MIYRTEQETLQRRAQDLEAEVIALGKALERFRVVARRAQVRRLRRIGIALVIAATVVPLFVLLTPHGCPTTKESTHIDLKTIANVVEALHADKRPCPTMDGLVADKEISAHSKLTDRWGTKYTIACNRTVVRSAGPDQMEDTSDDIVVVVPE